MFKYSFLHNNHFPFQFLLHAHHTHPYTHAQSLHSLSIIRFFNFHIPLHTPVSLLTHPISQQIFITHCSSLSQSPSFALYYTVQYPLSRHYALFSISTPLDFSTFHFSHTPYLSKYSSHTALVCTNHLHLHSTTPYCTPYGAKMPCFSFPHHLISLLFTSHTSPQFLFHTFQPLHTPIFTPTPFPHPFSTPCMLHLHSPVLLFYFSTSLFPSFC